MATPTTFNSVITNPGGTGSSIVPTLSTHAAGDVIEIFVGNTGNVAWTAPAGWTRRHQSTVGTSSTGQVGTLLYRRVLPGDTLPLSSPTCNLGATVTRGAIAITRRGADVEGVYALPEWSATNTTTGTANPIRPPSVTTPAPEMQVYHYYCQRTATNAPEPSGYTQVQEIVISGTLVINVSEKNVADQQTVLSNQDASPTSGARWTGMISCAPSPDYPYHRSMSSATTASGTNVTPALPTGTTASDTKGNKDVLICTAEGSGATTLSMTDGAWTEITGFTDTTSGGGSSVKKWWAYMSGTLGRQVNRTGTGELSAYLNTYHNCHQSNPIGAVNKRQNASSTTSTWDALTRTFTKVTMNATCVADAVPTFTSPATWAERMDGLGMTCADQPFNATGSTASASFTLSTASPTLVGLIELKGIASQAGITTHERSASVSATASILTAAEFFSVFVRSSAVAASASVEASALSILERSLSVSATASLEVSGVGFSTLERTASVDASASIVSSGEAFTLIERSVDCAAIASVQVAGLRVADRSAILSATAAIETSGQFFSILDGATSTNATAVITVAGVRIVERSCGFGAGAEIQTSGISLTLFDRAASVDASARISTSAEFFSIFSRQASLDTTVNVTVAGQTTQFRSISASCVASISVSGVVEPPGAQEHERSASVSAVGSAESVGTFFSVLQRAISCDAVAGVSVSGLVVRERSLSISATGGIIVSGQGLSIFDGVTSLNAVADINTSGIIPAFTEWERSIAFGAIGAVSVSGGKWVPNVKRTVTVGLASREVTVPAPNRTLHVE